MTSRDIPPRVAAPGPVPGSVPVPPGLCPVCVGTGLEVTGVSGDAVVVTSCYWCSGSGAADAPPVPCPCCGRPGPVIEGEGVCPDCTVWLPTDGRYEDVDCDPDL